MTPFFGKTKPSEFLQAMVDGLQNLYGDQEPATAPNLEVRATPAASVPPLGHSSNCEAGLKDGVERDVQYMIQAINETAAETTELELVPWKGLTVAVRRMGIVWLAQCGDCQALRDSREAAIEAAYVGFQSNQQIL